MKQMGICILAVCLLVVTLCGCTPSSTVMLIGTEESPFLTFDTADLQIKMFSENIEQLRVSLIYETLPIITDQETIAAIADWAGALSLQRATFEEHKTPGDLDGGTYYGFSVPDNDDLFSYRINTGGGWAVLVAGKWYLVENPSDPPLPSICDK